MTGTEGRLRADAAQKDKLCKSQDVIGNKSWGTAVGKGKPYLLYLDAFENTVHRHPVPFSTFLGWNATRI